MVRVKILFGFGLIFTILISWSIVWLLHGKIEDLRVTRIGSMGEIYLSSGEVVSLAGVDMPKSNDIAFLQAKTYLEQSTENRTIFLEQDSIKGDRYGNPNVWIWIGCESTPVFDGVRVINENPPGCISGKLLNVEMVSLGHANVSKNERQANTRYYERIKMAQTDWDLEQLRRGYKVDEVLINVGGMTQKTTTVRRYPGTIFSGFRLYYPTNVSSTFESGVLSLATKDEELKVEQLQLKRVRCNFEEIDQMGIDLRKSKFVEKETKMSTYRLFESADSQAGSVEYLVCEKTDNGYWLGSKYGFVSINLLEKNRARLDWWWKIWQSLEDVEG